MATMTARPTPRELRHFKTAVVMAAAADRPSLSDFLARLRGLHPDLDAALDGIYCGATGRVSEPIGEWGHRLTFNWYSTETRRHFVEWAYIS